MIIAGVIVLAIIGILFVFHSQLEGAAKKIAGCVQGAVSGDFGGCRGGSGGAAVAAGNPGKLPGMREVGLASGLVTTGGTPGGTGRGAGNPTGRSGPGLDPSMARNALLGGRGGRDSIPPDVRQRFQDGFGRLIKIAAPVDDGMESKWETAARVWNRATGGGAMESAMANSEALGDRAWGHGMQSMRTAREKFNGGDIDGANAAIRDAQRWFGAAGRNYAAANSTKADMAGQAADEAKFIADTSRQVNTAIAAAANPVGFATGMVVGTGVQGIAEATLPPGMGRDLAVSITTAGLTIYAGGITGTPQILGTRVLDTTTQQAVGYVNTVANAAMTAGEKGLSEGGKEIAVALITEAIMRAPVLRTPVLPGSSPNPKDSRRSLNDALSVMGEQRGNSLRDQPARTIGATERALSAAAEQRGNAIGDSVSSPSVKAAIAKTANDVAGELSKAGNRDGIEQALQGQSHTAKGNDAAPPRELPPPSADFRSRFDQTPRPTLSPESRAAARAGGINEDMAADLVRISAADGNEIILRPNRDTVASDRIQNGTGVGKSTDIHAKTGDHNAIPVDQRNSKNGAALRNAEAELAQAQQSGNAAQISQATDKLNRAQANLDAAQADIAKNLASGKYEAQFRPEVNDTVLIDKATGKMVVGDHDSYASTATRPDEPMHNYGPYGQGTEASAQSLANQRWALGERASARQHFDQSTAPPETGKFLPPMGETHVVITKDGLKLIEGKGNLIDYMRSHGMRFPPGANVEAGRAFQGQETQRSGAIAAGTASAHNLNQQDAEREGNRPPVTATEKQAFLEGTRLQGQKQYAADAKNAAAAQARDATDPNASARQRLVNEGVPRDKAQTEKAQQQMSGTLFRQRAAENKALENPTPQTAAALDNANQNLRDTLSARARERGEADAVVSTTFGTPRGVTPPGTIAGSTNSTMNRLEPSSPSLARLADWMIARTSTSARGPVLALWLAPMELAAAPSQSARQPLMTQSMVHERVHAHASPAWRSEFERLTALHEGVSEYFTEFAFERVAGRQAAAFPAFAVQTDIASHLTRLVGWKTLESAYFRGDTIGLHTAMGQIIGGPPEEALGRGRAFFGEAGRAMNEGQNTRVLQQLVAYAAAGAPDPATVPSMPAEAPRAR